MLQDGPNVDTVDALVVGAGLAGLAAADALAARGFTVQVVEGAPSVGGLARSICVGGEEIEAYYHHVFPQDRALRNLIGRLGLSEKLEWRRASTAVLTNGRLYPFDSVLDLLRFRPLSLPARVRLGFGSALALVRGRGRRLERMRVGDAGPRWFGRGGYTVLWQPLLDGKFGPFAHDVSLAWLVGRMKQRANARKSGTGDRLGYLRGGLGALAVKYEEEISAHGVRVSCGMPVDSLVRDADRWHVRFGGREVLARTVVACLSGESLGKLTSLPDAYRRTVEAIPYRAVTCAMLELDRPLGSYYWVNLIQPTDLACLAVIEHTNFIPADRYGERHIVYLTHYVEVGGRAWNAQADEIVDAAEVVLLAINPAFERGWIQATHVSRDRWAQPVPLAGGPMPGLSVDTGLPGLFHASLAHIYPDDRGVSLALELGGRVGKTAAEWLATTGREAMSGGV